MNTIILSGGSVNNSAQPAFFNKKGVITSGNPPAYNSNGTISPKANVDSTLPSRAKNFPVGGNPTWVAFGQPCYRGPGSTQTDSGVTVRANGVSYSDSVTWLTQTTSSVIPGAAPTTTFTAYTSRNTNWNTNNGTPNCSFPTVSTYTCVTQVGPITYNGVSNNTISRGPSGTGASSTVTIPKPGTIESNYAKTASGTWSILSGGPQTQLIDPNFVDVPSGATWQWSGVAKTTYGGLSTSSQNSLGTVQSQCKLTTPGVEIVAPAYLTNNGIYKISATYDAVKCYVVNDYINGLYLDHCGTSYSTPISDLYFAKQCGNIYSGIDKIPSGLNFDIASKPCTGTPPPPVKGSGNGNPSPSSYIVDGSCSVSGNPMILSPNASPTAGGGTPLQVISNQHPWGIRWASPILGATNTAIPETITNKRTSLIVSPGFTPFKYNFPANDPSQPVTGTFIDPNGSIFPILNYSTDDSYGANAASGWGIKGILQFYKKGSSSDKFIVSQRDWYTASFLTPVISVDNNGNPVVVGAAPVNLTFACDSKVKQSFQVLGVNALPGQ